MIIRMIMFPVALLAVLYLVIMFVVPTAQSISITKEMIVEEQEILKEKNKRYDQVAEFEQSIQSHVKEKEFVMNFVPNDQKEEILISDISQLANDTGVNLFSIGFSEGRQDVRSSAATDDRADLMEGKMIISGNYENIKSFLNQLFHIKRLYAFKTFALTKSEKENNEEDTLQDMVLSSSISFAYGFIPGNTNATSLDTVNPIDFDLINTVMNSSANTDLLVTQIQERKNPFLP